MRRTHALKRCAALVRAAARHVGQSLGRLGRTAIHALRRATAPIAAAATRAVAPTTSAVRARLARLARVAIPITAVACSRHEAPPAPPPPATAVEAAAAAQPPPPPAPIAVAPSIDATVAPPTALGARRLGAGPDELGDAAPERPIGDFLMTFYYIAAEEELAGPALMPTLPAPTELVDVATGAASGPGDFEATASPPAAVASAGRAANDNVATATGDDDLSLASGAAADRVPLLDRDCQPLIEVSPSFAAEIRMQGTGRLRDGRLINVAGACSCGGICFHFLPAGIKWGTGASGLPLSPFRMVAVDPDLIPLGSLLYLPELDGRRMPGRPPAGGFIHDGCVVAADVGGAIKGRQLDLFVARRAYYVGLARRGSSHAWATSVEVWDGTTRCTRRGSRVSRSAAASI